MAKLTAKDGTEIFYKDWGGSGQPIVFAHGWPLTSDMWDNQMMVFGQAGYRVIAHDRRGFGRSGQNWSGNTNEQFADDLAELIETLDLHNAVLVSHSMAGGEACKYVARHGTGRLAKIVLLSAAVPLMLKTDRNADGVSLEMLNGIRAGVQNNRADFFQNFAKMFYGFNRLTHKTDDALIDSFRAQAMMAGVKPTFDCIHEFSAVDFTEDLKKFDKPTLVIHGDDDQTVPLAATARKTVDLLPHGTLKIYEGGTHAIAQLQAERFNADLLAFIGGA